MLLHDAIVEAVRANGEPMHPADLARAIAAAGSYRRGDGAPPPPSQIRARVRKYPHLLYVEDGLVYARGADAAAAATLSTSATAIVPAAPAAVIAFSVSGPPPAKDGGKSIFSPDHGHYPLVVALRTAAQAAMAARTPFVGLPLRLEVRYRRAVGRADGLNIVNGIADVLQRRPAAPTYANEHWAFDDDANIREVRYDEEPADEDAYEVIIAVASEPARWPGVTVGGAP